jgi:outer membrane lipoprotein carrier protein
MNKIILSLCAGTVLFAALPVPSQLRAHFTQSVLNRDANQTLTYEGRLAVRLPDKAKWTYTAPLPKIICLDGERAWVVEPELEQATLYRLGRTIPILAILERAEKVGKQRYKARYNGIDYEITVDERRRLKSVSYDDDLGNRVTMRFTHLDTSPFDATELACEIPKDFDIIDGRY